MHHHPLIHRPFAGATVPNCFIAHGYCHPSVSRRVRAVIFDENGEPYRPMSKVPDLVADDYWAFRFELPRPFETRKALLVVSYTSFDTEISTSETIKVQYYRKPSAQEAPQEAAVDVPAAARP